MNSAYRTILTQRLSRCLFAKRCKIASRSLTARHYQIILLPREPDSPHLSVFGFFYDFIFFRKCPCISNFIFHTCRGTAFIFRCNKGGCTYIECNDFSISWAYLLSYMKIAKHKYNNCVVLYIYVIKMLLCTYSI